MILMNGPSFLGEPQDSSVKTVGIRATKRRADRTSGKGTIPHTLNLTEMSRSAESGVRRRFL
jgi:hypothetical protein